MVTDLNADINILPSPPPLYLLSGPVVLYSQYTEVNKLLFRNHPQILATLNKRLVLSIVPSSSSHRLSFTYLHLTVKRYFK